MLSPTNGPEQSRKMEKYLAPTLRVEIMMTAPTRHIMILPMNDMPTVLEMATTGLRNRERHEVGHQIWWSLDEVGSHLGEAGCIDDLGNLCQQISDHTTSDLVEKFYGMGANWVMAATDGPLLLSGATKRASEMSAINEKFQRPAPRTNGHGKHDGVQVAVAEIPSQVV
ncbi:hypothetical protein CERZMDRAFT_102667 [Cercospora zeae-maydis SCOH1-5]|uniref:Uncharacterized protein n=1 Tax=Cercospora zeae-maydis SCOH1-5 TaxID=717836 RepID=A0A6A6F098_9PEZI|nr:hypothetical protein CERZMDRAFT_102667 [Cercospora zeae-maydis SCOH1-5]